jgi:CHAT domain-containing protein/Tfp pilus assembly protein PilF
LALFSGCSTRPRPQQAYEFIREEFRQGNLDSALQLCDREFQKYSGKDEYWAWRFRTLKAHVLIFRGSYNQSLQLLAPELPAVLARSDIAVRRKLIQGIAHDSTQRYNDSAQDLIEAAQLAQSYQPELVGDVAQARGNLEIDRKHYPEAVEAFQLVLTAARNRNLPAIQAAAFSSLGNVAMLSEHFDQALQWYGAALQKSQEIGMQSSIATVLGNMGWNYSMIGDYENAEALYKQALEKSGNAGLLSDRIYWLNNLGEVYYLQHRYAEAQATSEKALSLAYGSDDKTVLTACLDSASEIALATGHVDVAAKHNSEALQVEKANPDPIGGRRSQLLAGRIAWSQSRFPQAESAFLALMRDPHVETDIKWEAHARLAEVYASQHLPGKASSEFGEAIRTIQEARRAIHRDDFRMSFLSTAIEFYDSYVNFLIERKRQPDALRVADLSRAQTLEDGLASNAAKPASHAAVFNPQATSRRLNATLLFYWLGERCSYLWIITPAKISVVTLPASAEIDATVKAYRQSFLDPRDPLEAQNADGKKLYATLIEPAEKLIPKNSRVIVLPDGSLNSLNFETLIVAGSQPPGSQPQAKPHYWIEDATIITANSLALLSRSSVAAPPKHARLLVVGDALAASADFPPLSQAGKEIGLLESYFASPQRLELTGANATATKFLSSQPEKFSYLHFATHGTASRLRPLESAVILSPEGETYKLYARDVVKHPLTAYLVTISACNGAGTKSYAGEGLVGLSWAFLRAGAHNVIAGLWEVSNASTPQLMDELYKGLHAGEDPATALRNAKLTLVHSNGNYRKPFYWAPFLLYSGS